MPSPILRKAAAALLAAALLFGAVPAASALELNFEAYPDYAALDGEGDVSFSDGGEYWNNPAYWGDDFYYRDGYSWHPDFYLDSFRVSKMVYFTSPNVNRDGTVNQDEALRQIRYEAPRSPNAYATLRVMNGETMTLPAMQQVAAEARANGKTALVCAYTMLPSEEQHQTRLYFEPEAMAAAGQDVRLGVYSDNEWIYREKQEYLDEFTNYLELIRFAQRDEFPAAVQVYALIDLSKLDKTALRFYSVNRANGSVTEITNPRYSFAANGKLTFHTKLAGDILITDRTLSSKPASTGWISAERIAAEEPAAIAQRAAEAAQKAADLAAQAAAQAAAAVPGTTDAQTKADAAAAAQQAADSAAQAAADAAAAAAAAASAN